MSNDFLYQVALQPGRSIRVSRDEISDATMDTLAPWLATALETGSPQPLPFPGTDALTAVASTDRGGLLVTIYAADVGPVVTMGVAARSRHSEVLWSRMVANFGAAAGLTRPSVPWMAIADRTEADMPSEAPAPMFALFLPAIAWTWIVRSPGKNSTQPEEAS